MEHHLTTALTIEGLMVDGEHSLDISIFFPRSPLGCVTDDSKDTVSYNKCIEIARAEAAKKHYNLIEHLAHSVHAALKKELPMHLEIWVRAKKIKDGVSFTYFPKKDVPEKKHSTVWED